MPPLLRHELLIPSPSCTQQLCSAAQARSFSSTFRSGQRTTRDRRTLFRWLNEEGAPFRSPLPNSTNYLGAYDREGNLTRLAEAKNKSKGTGSPGEESSRTEASSGGAVRLPKESLRDLRPYPLNYSFVSQPVLSELAREEIWNRIMKQGKSVRDVSAELHVDMHRVGAVVRLKEIEKEWQRIGKPLARPYSAAIMSMLPVTPYSLKPQLNRGEFHESINDLPVHAATGAQIFHPTSESRHFTRADAAKAFDEKLLPADYRVPHPQLALNIKDEIAGYSAEEIKARQDARDEKIALKKQVAAEKIAEKEAAIKRIESKRYEFRFTPINVDDIGKDGRGHNGVGWRYGVPHMDRSRGQVKIPTRVG